MNTKWNFAVPRVQGIAPRQAHAGTPEGLWEREIGRDAFSGPAAHLYHRHPPTAWEAIDTHGPQTRVTDTASLAPQPDSPWGASLLLSNASVRIRYWKAAGAMDHLVRNADGDDLLFIHRGSCEMFCDFGHISLEKGDYFLLPRGTMWRIEPSSPVEMLLIESTDAAFRLPEDSVLGRHLPFDAGVFDVPAIDDAFRAQGDEARTQVRIKHRGRISAATYAFNPLDAEGWKGDLYPIRLNVANIRPISSHRAHVVGAGHTTFLSERFTVGTLMPAPSPTDPSVLRGPTFHDNVEYDEVLFIHEGPASADSSGVRPGLMVHDPRGVVHAPFPQLGPSGRATMGPVPNECTAIRVDTRDPLELGPDAAKAQYASPAAAGA